MQIGLFVFGILATPFSDFYGLLPLGEMQNELSAYIFLPLFFLIISSRLAGGRSRATLSIASNANRHLAALGFSILLVITISGILNFSYVFGRAFQGRLPIEKFFTSSLVVAYGFAIAYIAIHLLDRKPIADLIIKPVCISVCVVSVFALIEVLASNGGFMSRLYEITVATVHVGKRLPRGIVTIPDWMTIGRARSVCYEPPALATFAGSAWPWAYAGVVTARRGYRSAYFVTLLLCTGLVVVAMSRTSAVLLLGNIAVYILLRLVYLPTRPRHRVVLQIVSISLILVGSIILYTICLSLDAITHTVMTSSDYSDVTRYGLITAAINMFLSRPFLGYGFGAFGFHYVDLLPAWAYRSYEIRDYVAGINGWPPVYSSYARFAAETGIFGVATWVGIWLWAIRAVWMSTVAYQRATGRLLVLSYPLIMSCTCVLLLGVSLDSMRTPMMWISLGASCWFVGDVRRRLIPSATGRVMFTPRGLNQRASDISEALPLPVRKTAGAEGK